MRAAAVAPSDVHLTQLAAGVGGGGESKSSSEKGKIKGGPDGESAQTAEQR
jgi:hypothetical protein